jgi:ABC-2 type transport system permease protein
MWSVYRKEMRAYLVSPIPYVLVFIFAAFMAWWFFEPARFFEAGEASLGGFFGMIPWVFILIVPALSMRLWSEEARGGTLEVLMTMPMGSSQLVWGKFLSAWTLLLVCLLATFPIPLTVAILGDLDWGPVICGYLGALLLGGAMLALGVWISALTSHQIVAFLVAAVISLALVLMGLAVEVGGFLGAAFERISVSTRYQSLGRGVIDIRDILYFVTFTAFFLYLNTVAVENRRFR